MTDFVAECIEEDEQRGFVVDDDRKADWCVRKIQELEADTASWKTYYEEQLERIKAQNDSSILYFKELLSAYFASVPHKVTKTAESYKLPNGTLRLKQQQPEYTKDEPVIIEWARKNVPELVEDVPRLKWADLKKLGQADGEQLIIPETGEVVPGVKVIERGKTFVVEK